MGSLPPPGNRSRFWYVLWTVSKLIAALLISVPIAILMLTSSEPTVTPEPPSTPTVAVPLDTPTPGATPTEAPTPVRPTDTLVPGHLFYVKGRAIFELHGYEAPLLVTAGADPALSADGSRLAYLVFSKSYDDIYLYDRRTGRSTLFLGDKPTDPIDPRTGSSAAAPAWSGDGATLFFSYSNPGAQDPSTGAFDGTDLSVTSCPSAGPCNPSTAHQLSRPAFQGGGDDQPAPRHAHPSLLVYTAYGYQTIGGTPRTLGRLAALNPVTGAFIGYLTPAGSSALDPAWSPAGRYLAFTERDANDQRSSIAVMTVHQSALTAQDYDHLDFDHAHLLVRGVPFAREPMFSPDGKYLAYIATGDDGAFHLYVARVHLGTHPYLEPAQEVRRAGVVDADRLAWAR